MGIIGVGRRNVDKFSIDLTVKNRVVVDRLAAKCNLKRGPMINKIIESFCRMPVGIRQVIEQVCLDEYDRLGSEIECTEDQYYRRSMEEVRSSYLNILNLINSDVVMDSSENEPHMSRYDMADGYLLIPSDWIVVNPKKAKECRYAAVLECRNSAEYGVPHFIYFTNTQYPRDYSADMESDFFSLCRKVWPRFSEIEKLSEENQLIPDPENRLHCLNLEAHLAAPIIGLFHIVDQGEHWCNDPPYGAVIVRTNSQK